MKKIVAAVVVILVLAGVGVPYISGFIMEKGVRHSVAEFNSRYGDAGAKMKIEILNYDRGYSSTEIEYKIDLGDASVVPGIQDIIFVERAKHKYTGAVSKTSLEKNIWYTEFITEHLGGKDPFHLETEYTLKGDFRSVFTLDPFSAVIEGETLQSRAGEFVLESDFDFKQMKTSGNWEGASVTEKFEISGLSFDSDVRIISTYLWDGDMTFALEKMMATEGTTTTELANVKGEYTATYNEEKNTLEFDAIYGIENMLSNAEYIDNASARFGMKGIDAAAYEEAMELYMKMFSGMLSEMAELENNPEQLAQAVEAKMMEISFQLMAIYEKFLKGGLEIYISDLQADLPQGDIKGNLSIKLEKDMTMAQMFPMMNQPQILFDYISFATDFSMPSVLAGGNPQLINPIYPGMKTGLFVEEGDNLVHRSETKNKQLYINGELLKLN